MLTRRRPASEALASFGVSKKGSEERCRFRFFFRLLPFSSVFFRFFLVLFLFSSVFFPFLSISFSEKNGETPFARPLLRNPESCKISSPKSSGSGCSALSRGVKLVELESLSSLGFGERNLGCPGNFAGMSRTPGGVQKVCAKKVRAHFSSPICGRLDHSLHVASRSSFASCKRCDFVKFKTRKGRDPKPGPHKNTFSFISWHFQAFFLRNLQQKLRFSLCNCDMLGSFGERRSHKNQELSEYGFVYGSKL